MGGEGKIMSTKTSMAYVEYEREKGNLHIYFEMMDCKYYIQDEEGGQAELPKNIALDFVKVLETKYKHLIPKSPIKEWLEKQKKESNP